jgi:hypothetical protein
MEKPATVDRGKSKKFKQIIDFSFFAQGLLNEVKINVLQYLVKFMKGF